MIVAAHAASSVAARERCNTTSCNERVARKACSQTRVVSCIRRAALRWRVSFSMLLRKARCESGLDPYAVGFGVHRGLFQFNWPGTWATTPYRRRDVFSAKWNSLAAAWMHSSRVNRGNEWACT